MVSLHTIREVSHEIEHGAWVRDIPGADDLALKVRGLDCSLLAEAQAREMRRRRLAMQASGVPDSVFADLPAASISLDRQNQHLASIILLDWLNFEDEDGSPIPFSSEKALSLLSDPELTAFRSAVLWAAAQVGRQEQAS